MEYLTVPLTPVHRKIDFRCGNDLLDNYLHNQAKQDAKRYLSVCFIMPTEGNAIKGYYTLSNAGIDKNLLPEDLKNKLPFNYLNLPATLLGRLAVDLTFKRKGIGELLLMDALKRSYNTSLKSIASMAVVVDPIDDNAVNFYKKYGFIVLPDSGKMFLAMKTISQLF